MSRRVAVNLAVFGLAFLVMVGWAVNNVVSFTSLERPYPLSAEFANAFGVLPNAEVTYQGVAVGSVGSVRRRPGGVVVRMQIDREARIPQGASAHILRKSVIGEPYVDFEPPQGYEGGSRWYEAGAVVPQERTTVPLEFSEMLRSASALVSSIPPDDVATLLREAAAGLEGRTDSLRQLAEAGDVLTASLAERTEVLDRLAANQARVTRVVADHRTSLGQSLTDLRQVADSLRNAQGDTSVLLDRGSRLLAETAALVASQKGNLDCDLQVLEKVIEMSTTDARIRGLRALLDVGPVAFARVWDASDLETDGRWVRVGFIGNPRYNPPRQHQPPKEVPAVRPITACDSALRSTGVDYRPATLTARGPEQGMLPATGGGGAAVSATLAGILLGVRRLRRRAA